MTAPAEAHELPRRVDPGPSDPLPLSLLNDFLYCPRRAALKVVEGWREANVHTDRGDIVHEHSDLAGYEVAKGTLLWRALPVWSERLGLNGKCDIVEVEPAQRTKSEGARAKGEGERAKGQAGSSGFAGPTGQAHGGRPKALFPVEFKLGKRRRWDNDDAQLCAQALCLEEMFGVPVPHGAVFHADSKRRREVEFTPELRSVTEQAIAGLHALLGNAEGPATGGQHATANAQLSTFNVQRSTFNGQPSTANALPAPLPPAQYKPACQECSLYDICLPRATAGDGRPERLARQLFET